jgi:hypothetical protein
VRPGAAGGQAEGGERGWQAAGGRLDAMAATGCKRGAGNYPVWWCAARRRSSVASLGLCICVFVGCAWRVVYFMEFLESTLHPYGSTPDPTQA